MTGKDRFSLNTRRWTRHSSFIGLIASLAVALLLVACQPGNAAIDPPTAQPTPTQAPVQATPVPATQTPAPASGGITLDLSGVAQAQTVETVAAVPPSADAPAWEAAPQHRRVTLQGYPVTDHLMKPQIFIYPVADWVGINETGVSMTGDLQALLEDGQPVERMPFLPLFNRAQVMHAQVQVLDFKNGTGVRFLTQYDQGPVPVNNYELIYTFQGLTRDGKTYIAVILPVTHPDLPATDAVTAQQSDDLSDFPAYLTTTTAWLEEQPGSGFTPDLAVLDALIQSLEVE